MRTGVRMVGTTAAAADGFAQASLTATHTSECQAYDIESQYGQQNIIA